MTLHRLLNVLLLAQRNDLIVIAGEAATKPSVVEHERARSSRTQHCSSRRLLIGPCRKSEPGFTIPVFSSRPRSPTTRKFQQLTAHRTGEGAQDDVVGRAFRDSGGIVYKRGVLSADEFEAVRGELGRELHSGGSLRLQPESSNSIAKNRLGTQLPMTTETAQIMAQGSVHHLVNSMFSNDNQTWTLSTIIAPVELRVYEKVGAGMDWHQDDVLYDPPQVEVVLTLENTSDCVTSWKERSGRRVDVETDVNSAIFIRAGGPLHRVSPLKLGGRRMIVKFVYAWEDAVPLEKPPHQFAATAKKKKRR